MASIQCVVPLRGINVGGHNALPMDALRNCLHELGCTTVATYIQSGNAVCSLPADRVAALAAALATAIASEFQLAVPVLLRSEAEIEALVSAQPFQLPAESLQFLHVVFLAAPLSAEHLARLQAKGAGDEQFVMAGREIYLLLPHGFGRSKLAATCTAAWVPGSPTVRSWKTVLELRRMLQGL